MLLSEKLLLLLFSSLLVFINKIVLINGLHVNGVWSPSADTLKVIHLSIFFKLNFKLLFHIILFYLNLKCF